MSKLAWKSFITVVLLGLISTSVISQQIKVPYLKNEKWGFSDIKGNILYEPQFDSVSFFKEGRAEVYLGAKIGLLDSSLRYLIVKPEYQELRWVNKKSISEPVIIAKKNEKYGLISKYVDLLIPYNYDTIRNIWTGSAHYFYCKKGRYYEVFNLKGNLIEKLHSTDHEIIEYKLYSNETHFYSNSKRFKHNKTGELISTEDHLYIKRKKNVSEDYIEEIPEKKQWSKLYSKNGQTGLYYSYKFWNPKTRKNNIKFDTIQAIFDSIIPKPINQYRYAKFIALRNDKWGMINLNNFEVIPFKFDSIECTQNRTCLINKDGKWGAIKITDDKYPNHLLDINYESIKQTDLAWNSNFIVKVAGKRFFIFRKMPKVEIPIKNYEVLGLEHLYDRGSTFKLITILTKSGEKAFIGENGTCFFEE